MSDNETRASLLRHYPMLQELASSRLEALLATCTTLRLQSGTVIFDENQACQGFPLLLTGSVRVSKSSANGRELQLYRVLPGESCILTSSCLLGNTRYQARGIVVEPVDLIMLPAPVFHDLLGCEAFRQYVFMLFTERLTDLMELVSSVAFQKLDQRLAALLVGKANPIHATHQALADELGSAREIISRLLKGFSDQGWVRLGREQITLTDPAALKKFAAL